ncbi:MAG: EF-hand domain-containing protein, partial [Comamonas sp.]
MALICTSMHSVKKKISISRSTTIMKSAMGVLLTSAVLLLPTVRAEDSADKSGAKNSAQLSKGEIKAQQQFKMLDFNQDGKLSRKEVAIIPKLAAAFDETDTNKDGFVTYEEV